MRNCTDAPLHCTHHRRQGVLWLILLLLFSACQLPPPTQVKELTQTTQIAQPDVSQASGPIKVTVSDVDRPAVGLKDAVEQYLREFQPGPLPRVFQTTYLYDRNGVVLAELWDEGKRTWVGYNEIATGLITATISTEDATFFTNWGFDPLRIVAAVFQNAQEGGIVSGASTITMQLARNLFLGPEQRYDQRFDRKLLEVGLAQELNSLYTKRELLEMYLNLLNYGNLAYGPEAAAELYFDKHAADLTMAEATFLAGIPQRPLAYDPFLKFEAVRQRQRVVLDLMVAHLYLTQAEADSIFAEPITIVPRKTDASTVLAPHFVQFAELMLDKRFGVAGYIRRSGYEIYTTLDLRMQALAQKIMAEKIAQFRPQYNLGNAALVAIRPRNGEVVTLVGSVNFYDKSIDGQVNVPIHRRQPGSTLKPLLFAIGMNDMLISPASVMWDTPVAYDNGSSGYYRPQNYDKQFHGLVTARSALANSYNIPVVKLLDGMGIERALQGLANFGIRSLQKDPFHGLGLALGANEVTLMELTNAYWVLASEGVYAEPEVVINVTDRRGRPVDFPKRPDAVQALSPATAFQITDILSDNEARRPMFGANSALKLSRPAAAKTGTTSDFRDNWTMGYTKFLVTGVWTGNSNGQPMRNSTGVTGAAPIWNKFMEELFKHKDLLEVLEAPSGESSTDRKAWEFTPPSDGERRSDCPPDLYCKKGGEFFSEDWLTAAGSQGPLADSFITAPSVSAYSGNANDNWVKIYCESPEGRARTMLNLTGRLGLPSVANENKATLANTANTTVTLQTVEGEAKLPAVDPQQAGHAFSLLYFPESELERFGAIAWSINQSLPVNIGACDQLRYYTVQAGDYWGAIANRFGISAGMLQGANQGKIRGEGVLLPGDRLLVPTGVEIEIGVNGRSYVVESGDTWNDIASNAGLPLKLLLAINQDMVRPYLILQPGDEIWIPDNSEELASVVSQ